MKAAAFWSAEARTDVESAPANVTIPIESAAAATRSRAVADAPATRRKARNQGTGHRRPTPRMRPSPARASRTDSAEEPPMNRIGNRSRSRSTLGGPPLLDTTTVPRVEIS